MGLYISSDRYPHQASFEGFDKTIEDYLWQNPRLTDFTHLEILYQQSTVRGRTLNGGILDFAIRMQNLGLYFFIKTKISNLKDILLQDSDRYHFLRELANTYHHEGLGQEIPDNPQIVSIARDILKTGGDAGKSLGDTLTPPLSEALLHPKKLGLVVVFVKAPHTALDPHKLTADQTRMLFKAKTVAERLELVETSLKTLAQDRFSFVSLLPSDMRSEISSFFEGQTLCHLD